MSPASARALPATFPVAAVRDRWLFALAFAALAASFLLWSREDDALKASILAVGSAHPALDPLWRGASDLARGPGLVSAVFAISMAVHAPERRQLVLSSALLGGLLCQALKLLAHRARPLQDDLMLSWPSGHATSAFCAALALTLGARCSKRHIALVWTIAIVVVVSRVFLARHWPSDVVAALGVALVSVALARRIPLQPLVERLTPHVVIAIAGSMLLAVLVAMTLDPWGRHEPRAWAALLCLMLIVRNLATTAADRTGRADPS